MVVHVLEAVRRRRHVRGAVVGAHEVHDFVLEALDGEARGEDVEAEVVLHAVEVGGAGQHRAVQPAGEEAEGEFVEVGEGEEVGRGAGCAGQKVLEEGTAVFEGFGVDFEDFGGLAGAEFSEGAVMGLGAAIALVATDEVMCRG